MDAKYIVVEVFCGLLMMETPIIFPAYVGHDDMAKALTIDSRKVLAAGFVGFSDTDPEEHGVEVKAYGRSDSLGVGSREEDSRLIYKALALED